MDRVAVAGVAVLLATAGRSFADDTGACDSSGWCASPVGPNQMCRDDAGPPWLDDVEHYPNMRYHTESPAWPVLDGGCPAPLVGACESKGVKAAHLDGPVACGGSGWFCRIMPDDEWEPEGGFRDGNFAHCNASDADERDDDGHCHGSSYDDTYGWWIRDHWFRGYAGLLHCCCDWEATKGVVNRCDYRRHVDESEVEPISDSCRDANEDHGLGYEDGCAAHDSLPFADPRDDADSQCWTVGKFGDPSQVPAWDGTVWDPPAPTPAPSGPSTPPTPAPSSPSSAPSLAPPTTPAPSAVDVSGVEVGDLVLADGDYACVWKVRDDGSFKIEYFDGNSETADLGWASVIERCSEECSDYTDHCEAEGGGDEEGCQDSDAWMWKGKSSRGCDWVAKKPDKRCSKKDEDGLKASKACFMACGECQGCQDSAAWMWKGKSSRGCDWVAKKPDKRCSKKDEDGLKASKACFVACGGCD